MILSIVIPTLGRVSEVRELLKSIELSKIENLSFEIVIESSSTTFPRYIRYFVYINLFFLYNRILGDCQKLRILD
mgnify:CR=1 FL=1